MRRGECPTLSQDPNCPRPVAGNGGRQEVPLHAGKGAAPHVSQARQEHDHSRQEKQIRTMVQVALPSDHPQATSVNC